MLSYTQTGFSKGRDNRWLDGARSSRKGWSHLLSFQKVFLASAHFYAASGLARPGRPVLTLQAFVLGN